MAHFYKWQSVSAHHSSLSATLNDPISCAVNPAHTNVRSLAPASSLTKSANLNYDQQLLHAYIQSHEDALVFTNTNQPSLNDRHSHSRSRIPSHSQLALHASAHVHENQPAFAHSLLVPLPCGSGYKNSCLLGRAKFCSTLTTIAHAQSSLLMNSQSCSLAFTFSSAQLSVFYSHSRTPTYAHSFSIKLTHNG